MNTQIALQKIASSPASSPRFRNFNFRVSAKAKHLLWADDSRAPSNEEQIVIVHSSDGKQRIKTNSRSKKQGFKSHKHNACKKSVSLILFNPVRVFMMLHSIAS